MGHHYHLVTLLISVALFSPVVLVSSQGPSPSNNDATSEGTAYTSGELDVIGDMIRDFKLNMVTYWQQYDDTTHEPTEVTGPPPFVNVIKERIKGVIQDRILSRAVRDTDEIQKKLNDKIDHLESIKDKVQGHLEDRADYFDSIKENITDHLDDKIDKIDNVKDKLQDHLQDKIDLLEKINDMAQDHINDKINELDKIMQYVEDAVKGTITEKIDKLRLVQELIQEALKEKQAELEGVKDKAEDGLNGKMEQLGGMKKNVEDYLDDKMSALDFIGDKVENLIDDRIARLEKMQEAVRANTDGGFGRAKRAGSYGGIPATVRDRLQEKFQGLQDLKQRKQQFVGQKIANAHTAAWHDRFPYEEEDEVDHSWAKQVRPITDAKEDEVAKEESTIEDIIEAVKELKSNIIDKVMEKKSFIKSKVQTKLKILAEALSQYASEDEKPSTEEDEKLNTEEDEEEPEANALPELPEPITRSIDDAINAIAANVTETFNSTRQAVLRGLLLELFEVFQGSVAELRETRSEFFKAQQEMVEAASVLDATPSPNEDTTSSSDGPGGVFDFENLISFKTKLREMILKKNEYMQTKVQLKNEVVQALVNMSQTYQARTGTPLTYFDVLAALHDPNWKLPAWIIDRYGKSFANGTGQLDGSGGASGGNFSSDGKLQLAAASNAFPGGGSDNGSPTVVAVVLVACCAIALAVVVVGFVALRSRRRHQLYTHIPAERSVSTGTNYGSA